MTYDRALIEASDSNAVKPDFMKKGPRRIRSGICHPLGFRSQLYRKIELEILHLSIGFSPFQINIKQKFYGPFCYHNMHQFSCIIWVIRLLLQT